MNRPSPPLDSTPSPPGSPESQCQGSAIYSGPGVGGSAIHHDTPRRAPGEEQQGLGLLGRPVRKSRAIPGPRPARGAGVPPGSDPSSQPAPPHLPGHRAPHAPRMGGRLMAREGQGGGEGCEWRSAPPHLPAYPLVDGPAGSQGAHQAQARHARGPFSRRLQVPGAQPALRPCSSQQPPSRQRDKAGLCSGGSLPRATR